MQALIALAVGFFCLASAASAQVARVIESKGTSLVERAGAAPRFLGAGERLDARDTIRVANDSWVMLELADGSRITLRPNTVFRIDASSAGDPEALLMGLVKGGIRAAGFDARLCEADCAGEERRIPVSRPAPQPAARVVEMKGVAGAGRAGESVRLLVPGAMLYEGDAIVTGRNAAAVLAFRDRSRITLGSASRLALLQFRFDDDRRTGSAVIRHLGGFARLESGLIAKQGPAHYRFITPVGEVRLLGTIFNSFVDAVRNTAQDAADTAGDKKREADEAAKRTTEAVREGVTTINVSPDSGGGLSISSDVVTIRLGTGGNRGSQIGNSPASSDGGSSLGGFPSVAAIPEQFPHVSVEVSDVARDAGNAFVNQVTNTAQGVADTAVNQAVSALNNATASIVAEMTVLMTQIRNNPPQTEAAAQAISAQIAQLSQQLNTALSAARTVAGQAAQSDAFKSAVGMHESQKLAFYSALALSLTGGYSEGAGYVMQLSFQMEIDRIRADPYFRESVGLVGLSDADLVEARSAGRTGHVVIEREVASYLASQGSAAAKAFFSEASAALAAARQRTAAAEGETTATSRGAGSTTDPAAMVTVLEGEVEVLGRGRVRQGETLTANGSLTRVANLNVPPITRADPELFGEATGNVGRGLYVWVRNGAVRVSAGAEPVDVAAGDAVVVSDRTRRLATVPGFMLLDPTPGPSSGLGSTPLDRFAAADGAVFGSCRVR